MNRIDVLLAEISLIADQLTYIRCQPDADILQGR